MKRQVTAIIEREGDGYVALCPEFDVASQGETVQSARDNLREALELFFESASPEEIEQRPTRAIVLYLAADAEATLHPGPEPARRLEEAAELAAELGFISLERAGFERAAEAWKLAENDEAGAAALRRAAAAMHALETNLPTELQEAFGARPENEALRALVPV